MHGSYSFLLEIAATVLPQDSEPDGGKKLKGIFGRKAWILAAKDRLGEGPERPGKRAPAHVEEGPVGGGLRGERNDRKIRSAVTGTGVPTPSGASKDRPGFAHDRPRRDVRQEKRPVRPLSSGSRPWPRWANPPPFLAA